VVWALVLVLAGGAGGHFGLPRSESQNADHDVVIQTVVKLDEIAKRLEKMDNRLERLEHAVRENR